MTADITTEFACGKYGPQSFFDLYNGGGCWSCPDSNWVRTIYPVYDSKACAIPIKWVSYRRAPGLFFLPGSFYTLLDVMTNNNEYWCAIFQAVEQNGRDWGFPVLTRYALLQQMFTTPAKSQLLAVAFF